MARARNIKPSIMDNEELAELEPITRLLFIYLWMLADRDGRLEDRPKRIAAQALAYDRDANVDSMLNGLCSKGFITRYKANGMACIQITAFAKHQTPHVRETASALPEYEESITKEVPTHDLGNAETSPRSPDTPFPLPDTGLGTAQAKPAKPARKQKAIKTELPDGFGISDRVRAWAGLKKFDRLDEHLESFLSKAKAKAYTYADWDEALMNAIRDDWAKLRVHPRYQQSEPSITVPSKPGIDPALAKAINDQLTCKGMPSDIRAQVNRMKGIAA